MTFKKLGFKATKYACFSSYVSGSAVFALPAILFTTFREMYGISYTLLGTLVLVNFTTQLIIDLIFTFYSKYFNVKKTVVTMPILTSLGLVVYALVPTFFPKIAYLGLVIGTVIFSVAAGLGEVLLSPIIAALPSDNNERDMSVLHSLYGYGVLMVVGISTLFLNLFGNHNWMYLTLFFAALPLISACLYALSPMPDLSASEESGQKDRFRLNRGLLLCAICIFLGASAENAMTNWISGFMEKALGISKSMGDLVGIALFALLLAFTRSIYAKYGHNIGKTLLLGMIGATICYLTAGLVTNSAVCAVACVLTGICTSMLWPGTLIFMEENMPSIGVAAYALMAAGGDMGSSIAPQLLGAVTDTVAASGFAEKLSVTLSLSAEQIGMKAGMLVSSLFPIFGIAVVIIMRRYFKGRKNENI
ncbi:MAG: MFS transporter [Clostridia bacterium]|nr:MFS transporter [Clostridia bacterium]